MSFVLPYPHRHETGRIADIVMLNSRPALLPEEPNDPDGAVLNGADFWNAVFDGE